MANTGNMEEYRIVKEIKFTNSKVPAGGKLQLVYMLDSNNPTVYMDGGLMPPGYQNTFKNLVREEKEYGWNYLKPLKSIRDKI